MPIGSTKLNDGRYIPNLAFGSGSAMRGKDASGPVLAALTAGFRHVDTAQAYRNEETVGSAIHEWFDDDVALAYQEGETTEYRSSSHSVTNSTSSSNREDIWVTTKYNGDELGPLKSLQESLEKARLLTYWVSCGTNSTFYIVAIGICRFISRSYTSSNCRKGGRVLARV
jgi:diketogulonate reductase-like aldo/keto reductase